MVARFGMLRRVCDRSRHPRARIFPVFSSHAASEVATYPYIRITTGVVVYFIVPFLIAGAALPATLYPIAAADTVVSDQSTLSLNKTYGELGLHYGGGLQTSVQSVATILPSAERPGWTPAEALTTLADLTTTQYVGRALDLSPYPTLVFSDDFTTLSLADEAAPPSAAKWFAPVHTDYGWASFAHPAEHPGAFTIVDGQLRLRLEKIGDQWIGANMQSANLSDEGFLFRRGYVEARMLAAQLLGGWSAFWMTSEDGAETGMHAEIDAMESYGAATYGFTTTYHIWPGGHPPSGATTTHRSFRPSPSPKTQVAADGLWHTYGIEITDQWIISYLDRVEIGRMPMAAEFNDGGFRLILSLAGGPNTAEASAVGPIDMFVDYVKAWSAP
jgi:beta-glucanase (GH16 family)